jgi:hypothetical protein
MRSTSPLNRHTLNEAAPRRGCCAEEVRMHSQRVAAAVIARG